MTGMLLDTHTWLWVQRGEMSELTPASVRELERAQAAAELYVSAISVLEIARLVAVGDYDLGIPVDQFVEEGVSGGGFRLLELSPRILIESTRLPGNIHRDPADRILAATAREHNMTLITRDKKLLEYAEQGHLRARKP